MVTLSEFADRRVFIGVDMASVQDLAALFIGARDGDGWIVWCRQYGPEAQIRKRALIALVRRHWPQAMW